MLFLNSLFLKKLISSPISYISLINRCSVYGSLTLAVADEPLPGPLSFESK